MGTMNAGKQSEPLLFKYLFIVLCLSMMLFSPAFSAGWIEVNDRCEVAQPTDDPTVVTGTGGS